MNEGQVKEQLRNVIAESVEKAYEIFVDEKSIPNNFFNSQEIILKVTEDQSEYSFDDFKEYRGLDSEGENETQDKVEDLLDELLDYVKTEYDLDYLVVKVEEEADLEVRIEHLKEEIVTKLGSIEPYSAVPRTYWNNQLMNVRDLKDLMDAEAEELEGFVEKYAPDWKEVAEENK